MNKITDVNCPRCGAEKPLKINNESNGEEYFICFDCAYEKRLVLKRDDRGEVILPTDHEIMVMNHSYAAVKIEYSIEVPEGTPPGALFLNKKDFESFKALVNPKSMKESNVKKMVFGRYENGSLTTTTEEL